MSDHLSVTPACPGLTGCHDARSAETTAYPVQSPPPACRSDGIRQGTCLRCNGALCLSQILPLRFPWATQQLPVPPGLAMDKKIRRLPARQADAHPVYDPVAKLNAPSGALAFVVQCYLHAAMGMACPNAA